MIVLKLKVLNYFLKTNELDMRMEANRRSWWVKEVSNISRDICDWLKEQKGNHLWNRKVIKKFPIYKGKNGMKRNVIKATKNKENKKEGET